MEGAFGEVAVDEGGASGLGVVVEECIDPRLR